MTETVDQNDSSSGDHQEIIELTDIIDEIVSGDGKTDQSHSTIMDEKGVTRDYGSLLSDDAIEAALLRVVEKKYAGQLDALFAEAVERVVKQEIAAIKQSLLKNL